MHHREESSWEQLCILMERTDLPLPAITRTWALHGHWSPLHGTCEAWQHVWEQGGFCLPQVWHPHVQMRGHFPIMCLPCKVSYFFCIYRGQTAFVTSLGGCCWVWITLGIRLSLDMFQHEQKWILEGLGVLKISADGTFTVRRKYHRKDNAEPEYNLQWLRLSDVCQLACTNGDSGISFQTWAYFPMDAKTCFWNKKTGRKLFIKPVLFK